MATDMAENNLHALGRVDRPHALADIQYGAIVASDPGTPSEEEDESKVDEAYSREEAERAIRVSIGTEQTRLTSPRTPAAEKAAAMEDLDGGALFDSALPPDPGSRDESPPGLPDENVEADDIGTPTEVRRTRRSPAAKDHDLSNDSKRLPSPWRAQPRRFTRLDATRNTLRESFGGRRRAWSGGMSSEAIKKMMANLPSLPKTPSMLNFSFPNFPYYSSLDWSSEGTASKDHLSTSHRLPQSSNTQIPQSDGAQVSSLARTTSSSTILPDDSQRPQRPPLKPLPSILRKSASYDSLLLQRGLSRASSLGDDTRFENVQEQVNSRFKAIKDSFQDSNFKLPSMPARPSFNFGSFHSDLQDDKRGPRSLAPSTRRFGSSSASRSPVPLYKRGSLASSSATANSVMNHAQAVTHPYFSKALDNLRGDVVVMGGYRGSVLRSAEPPHRQLWVPIKVGLNIRKVDLEVGLNPEDEEKMEDTIIPDGILKNIGPVDLARRLLKRLKNSDNARSDQLRVHDYGYDWRLSPHLLSRKLIKFLETLPCNQPGVPAEERGAIVIAHSLGGLITRHAVNSRPELFAGVVYAGVPNSCVNILGPLRNGDDVLFSSRVLTAQVNFTIRTSYALLPLDGTCFIDKKTKEKYPVDFFDVQNWIDYRLSPCIKPPLPSLNASNTTISDFISSMASVLPTIQNPLSRKNSLPKSNSEGPTTETREAIATSVHNAEAKAASSGANNFQPHMGTKQSSSTTATASHAPSSTSVSTACTIPYPDAVAYLTRTLAEVKQFKLELAHQPAHSLANSYPPFALIYGKSTPTVYGAKVDGRDGIKRTDAYDELAFASGDGVVLARSAQLPPGYEVTRGGVVSSERGHVTLLGDLEAVGRCLNAVIGARRKGVGLGVEMKAGRPVEEKKV